MIISKNEFSEEQITGFRLLLQQLCQDPDITKEETVIFMAISRKMLINAVVDLVAEHSKRKQEPTIKRPDFLKKRWQQNHAQSRKNDNTNK